MAWIIVDYGLSIGLLADFTVHFAWGGFKVTTRFGLRNK
jgi:hypothetical protein